MTNFSKFKQLKATEVLSESWVIFHSQHQEPALGRRKHSSLWI